MTTAMAMALILFCALISGVLIWGDDVMDWLRDLRLSKRTRRTLSLLENVKPMRTRKDYQEDLQTAIRELAEVKRDPSAAVQTERHKIRETYERPYDDYARFRPIRPIRSYALREAIDAVTPEVVLERATRKAWDAATAVAQYERELEFPLAPEKTPPMGRGGVSVRRHVEFTGDTWL